ncbi:hypothetical protein OG423_05715 [Micromonospora zamorensis]|uniref:hypothetical protein n=1 Tax=Micromonospora zamorensis TaxID=709883 RepID=UPI00352B4462|nr:hypothetical protein OG423_05715 [Micromonospora zamorensis]
MLVNLVMRTGGGGPRFVAEPAPIEPVRRKKVENAEPGVLMEHFHKDGWTVQDVRLGNLYDATATKNGRTLAGVQRYGDGRCCGHRYQNEVEWAHPGDCVIGTFSDVTFPPIGEVDTSSGIFRPFTLDPYTVRWHRAPATSRRLRAAGST